MVIHAGDTNIIVDKAHLVGLIISVLALVFVPALWWGSLILLTCVLVTIPFEKAKKQ